MRTHILQYEGHIYTYTGGRSGRAQPGAPVHALYYRIFTTASLLLYEGHMCRRQERAGAAAQQ
jgi:hypothetical protein